MLRPLIDEDAAAAMLGVSVRTLQKARVTGLGCNPPFIKLGRLVRYRPEDIEAFVAANTRASTSQLGRAA